MHAYPKFISSCTNVVFIHPMLRNGSLALLELTVVLAMYNALIVAPFVLLVNFGQTFVILVDFTR